MTAAQRRLFWAMVCDVAKQVPLRIGGYDTLAHKDDWRNVFCCGLMNENRIAEGLDGQKVVLGMRLRDIFAGLSDEEARSRASLLIEVVYRFGAENGVAWSDPETLAMAREETANANGPQRE
jgi:hypothetical protein